MRKHNLRILCALIGLAGFGAAAQAQTIDRINVKIPFEFEANGKELPAGNYTVRRVTAATGTVLVISSVENRGSVFVTPNDFEYGPIGKISLSFERVGEKHFLTAIEAGDHRYGIPVSRKAIMQASMKAPSGAAAPAGAAGNN